jgi:hypothetical protein
MEQFKFDKDKIKSVALRVEEFSPGTISLIISTRGDTPIIDYQSRMVKIISAVNQITKDIDVSEAEGRLVDPRTMFMIQLIQSVDASWLKEIEK